MAFCRPFPALRWKALAGEDADGLICAKLLLEDPDVSGSVRIRCFHACPQDPLPFFDCSLKQVHIFLIHRNPRSRYVSRVKRKCGLPVGECCYRPRYPSSVFPHGPPEKGAAIWAALEHFQMLPPGWLPVNL